MGGACNEFYVDLAWNISGGEGGTWVNFAGYVPLASQSPYPIVVCSMAYHRPHLGHFWGNM